MSDKCQSECASGPVADLLNDLGVGHPPCRSKVLATAKRHSVAYSTGARPACLLKRSKKSERDRPAAFAIAEATDLAISLDVEKVARLGAQIRI